MRAQILEILEDIQPGEDFEGCTDLIEEDVLDSLDIVTLVSELSDEFDIDISVADIIPENFQSVDSITALVTKLQDE